MALSLKPGHLSRYRDIARLLLKYGRGDLVKGSELENYAPETERIDSKTNGVTVHERPGEILERQRAAEQDKAEGGSGSGGGGGKAPPKGKETATGPALGKAGEPGKRLGGGRDSVAKDKPAEFADDLERMGVTYVKVGQFLSTRSDVLPTPYLDALSRLQDRVAPFPYEDVERIIDEELGVRISKAFAAFEREPVASASTGQVHRAQLHSGMVVAVKVQRPGVEEEIPRDLDVLAEIAAFLDRRGELGIRYDFSAMAQELKKTLLREIDYRQESRNLVTLGQNLAEFHRIVVPTPVDDYTTQRVLTMEFVHGRKVTSLGPLAKLEIDADPLADEMCHAYLKQMLIDGFFHADPHPGNIFLTDDGRIAMIDLGMVGQIPPALQENLLKFIVATSEGRGEDAGDIMIRIGTPLPNADPAAVRTCMTEMVIGFQGLRLRDLALGRLLFDAVRASAERGYRMPREMTMIGKTLLNIDEVARRLNPDFDPNASIRKHAAAITNQRMMADFSPGKLMSGLLEMKKLAETLPRRLNQVIEAVAENRLRVKVDAIDEVMLLEGMQKIANRITVGVMIAAMIIGAAMLMRIDTHFKILGYPGLAILFFLVAALAAIFLMGDIMIHDYKSAKDKKKALKLQKNKPVTG